MAKVIDAILSLKDNFTANMNRSITSMERSQKQAKRTAKEFEKAGKSLDKTGTSLSKGITVPIAGALTASTVFATQFGEGMAKIQTVADTTQLSLNQISDGVLRVSNKTGQAATDIQGALYDAISAGVDTGKSLTFIEQASKLAKGGFSTVATSADGLTSVLNAYGLKANQVSKISNQMMVAQNLGKTTIDQIASSISQVTPTAANLKVTTDDLFASLASLTANGIKTSEAVAGLKAAYSNILKPTTEASKKAKEIGLNFSASHLKSVGWSKFLEEIKTKTKGNTQTISDLFGSTEALNTILALTSKGGMNTMSQALEQMKDGTNYVDKAFKTISGSSGQKLKDSLNKIKNSSIKLADSLVPMIDKAASAINKLTKWFNKLSPAQQKMVTNCLLVAAALGPVLKVFGNVSTGIGMTIKAYSKLSVALSKPIAKILTRLGSGFETATIRGMYFSDGMKRVGANALSASKNVLKSVYSFVVQKGAMIGAAIATKAAAVQQWFLDSAILSCPITWIIAGIIALIAIVILLVKNWKKVSAFFKQLWAGIVGVFKTAINGIVGFFTRIGTWIKSMFAKWGPTIIKVLFPFLAIPKLVVKNWGKIMQFFGRIGAGIKGAFNGLGKFFTNIWDGISSGFKGFVNIIIKGLNFLIRGINKLKVTIPKWVPGLGGKTIGFSIPEIPMLAKGTPSFGGGPAIIGENGPELLELPRGARVTNNNTTRKILSKTKIVFEKLADTLVIREEADIDKIATAFVRKVKEAELNMA